MMTDVQDFMSEQALQDKERDLAAAKEAIAGPVPLIPAAPNAMVTLRRGLFVDGSYKTNVSLRELTGADEEKLAKAKEMLDFFDTVLALGVESIDDFDLMERPLPERRTWLGRLIIGERDQLFKGIVQVTFGDHRTVGFKCAVCEEQQEMDMILSEDLKPQEVPEELSMDNFDYTTSKNEHLIARLVTGEDQREAFARKGATVAEQNTIILSRCISKLNGGLVPDPMGFARSLSIRDRNALLADLVRRQPFIDLGVTTKCAACGADQSVALTWWDLFRS